jgi:hypothetical protein
MDTEDPKKRRARTNPTRQRKYKRGVILVIVGLVLLGLSLTLGRLPYPNNVVPVSIAFLLVDSLIAGFVLVTFGIISVVRNRLSRKTGFVDYRRRAAIELIATVICIFLGVYLLISFSGAFGVFSGIAGVVFLVLALGNLIRFYKLAF